MNWYNNYKNEWKEIIETVAREEKRSNIIVEKDYNFVTKKLLYEDYSYDKAISNGIAKVIDTDVFLYKR